MAELFECLFNCVAEILIIMVLYPTVTHVTRSWQKNYFG
uniref:Uncharacterized protein n=1 Tax=Arundo donax TaxID=35708 RepID=A0A0A8Z9Y7_ARUDO